MCFNYKVSLLTFFIGVTFSIILFKYGNAKYSVENQVSSIFLVFISSIQFMDFLFWIDIKNIYGINKVTTILGPILNVCQPTIFYIIKYLYYKPNISSLQNFNLPVAILNFLYVIYFIHMYINFLSKDKLVTSTQHNHLQWPWIKYSNPYYYLLLFGINIFYLFNFKYALALFTITYFFLFLSVKYFFYNAGELWCFFGSFIPLLMYFMSFYIDKIFP
jgi:hypothetical protein